MSLLYFGLVVKAFSFACLAPLCLYHLPPRMSLQVIMITLPESFHVLNMGKSIKLWR